MRVEQGIMSSFCVLTVQMNDLTVFSQFIFSVNLLLRCGTVWTRDSGFTLMQRKKRENVHQCETTKLNCDNISSLHLS